MRVAKKPVRKSTKPRRKSTRPRATAKKWIKKGSAEFASCKELYTISGMISNTPYQDLEQALPTYGRATAIAENYQFFRIKYIKYKFMSRYNMFPATTNETLATPLPYLYYMVDKAGALPTATGIAQLKAEGAKPNRFTGNVIAAFKPGVSIATANTNDTVLSATAYKTSPWLMTNKSPQTGNWVANDTDHRGLYWYMETIGGLPGDGTYEYDCEVEVMFEFKKPLEQIPVGQLPAIRASTLPHRSNGIIVNPKEPQNNHVLTQ